MGVYYYATERPEPILRDGFRDPDGAQLIEGRWMRGVFLCDWPRGASTDRMLEVVVPASCDFSAYAIVEAGSVSEWCVPAAEVNACATVRLLPTAEVEEIIRTWSYVRRSRGS